MWKASQVGGFFVGEIMLVKAENTSYFNEFTIQLPNQEVEPSPAEQLENYLTEMRDNWRDGFEVLPEKIIKTTDGREIFITILDPEKLFDQPSALMVEAHPDDAALAGGVANMAADNGLGVSYITLTDGAARELEGYESREALALTRRKESVGSAKLAGGAMVINLGYPDANLHKHKKYAAKEVRAVMNFLDTEVVISTHGQDKHKDHRAGFKIARRARGNNDISHYATDTHDGRNRWGFRTQPTHFIELTPYAKEVWITAFKAHRSQQPPNIPSQDEKDTQRVFHMTRRNGERAENADWVDAAALTLAHYSSDRLSSRFCENGVMVAFSQLTPRLIYQRARSKAHAAFKKDAA